MTKSQKYHPRPDRPKTENMANRLYKLTETVVDIMFTIANDKGGLHSFPKYTFTIKNRRPIQQIKSLVQLGLLAVVKTQNKEYYAILPRDVDTAALSGYVRLTITEVLAL